MLLAGSFLVTSMHQAILSVYILNYWLLSWECAYHCLPSLSKQEMCKSDQSQDNKSEFSRDLCVNIWSTRSFVWVISAHHLSHLGGIVQEKFTVVALAHWNSDEHLLMGPFFFHRKWGVFVSLVSTPSEGSASALYHCHE